MFVIWSGCGALTIVVVAVVAIVVGALVQLILGALGYPQLALLAASIGLFSAATANWFIGRRMNATPPANWSTPRPASVWC